MKKSRILSLLFLVFLILQADLGRTQEKPSRIVSMNLCTDQLLLLLADPANIASLSFLSLEEDSSYFAKLAKSRDYFINHAKPEEIIPLRPDLIVTGTFSHKTEARLLSQLGYKVEVFPIFHSLSDVYNNIRKLAKLIGETERGENMIATMQEKLISLINEVPNIKISAISYHARGYTQGQATLMNELMTLAGWHNIALDFDISGYSPIALEDLLVAQPSQLIYSRYSPGTRSLGQQSLSHPVLKTLFQEDNSIHIDSRLLICGGPMNIEALKVLVEARNAH